MGAVFLAWAISAAVLLLIAWLLGKSVGGALGILIDSRGRYSLTQFQLVAWSVVVLSLISGVFWGRIFHDLAGTALDFTIPDELLVVLGISIGSAAVSSAVKASKDADHPEAVAASGLGDKPRLAQMFWVEEGAMADKAVDVGKYQNFLITLILLAAYVALAIASLSKIGTAGGIMTLPGFDARFVTLLGISHAGYLAGKLPNPSGIPSGLTVARRAAGAGPAAAAAPAVVAPTFVPRNPAS